MPSVSDYEDWTVSAAVAHAAEHQISITIYEGTSARDPRPEDSEAVIIGHHRGSEPGSWVDVGGTVGVILFPFEAK